MTSHCSCTHRHFCTHETNKVRQYWLLRQDQPTFTTFLSLACWRRPLAHRSRFQSQCANWSLGQQPDCGRLVPGRGPLGFLLAGLTCATVLAGCGADPKDVFFQDAQHFESVLGTIESNFDSLEDESLSTWGFQDIDQSVMPALEQATDAQKKLVSDIQVGNLSSATDVKSKKDELDGKLSQEKARLAKDYKTAFLNFAENLEDDNYFANAADDIRKAVNTGSDDDIFYEKWLAKCNTLGGNYPGGDQGPPDWQAMETARSHLCDHLDTCRDSTIEQKSKDVKDTIDEIMGLTTDIVCNDAAEHRWSRFMFFFWEKQFNDSMTCIETNMASGGEYLPDARCCYDELPGILRTEKANANYPSLRHDEDIQRAISSMSSQCESELAKARPVLQDVRCDQAARKALDKARESEEKALASASAKAARARTQQMNKALRGKRRAKRAIPKDTNSGAVNVQSPKVVETTASSGYGSHTAEDVVMLDV